MRCMAIGKRTKIYHMDRFGNMGALYDVVPEMEVE